MHARLLAHWPSNVSIDGDWKQAYKTKETAQLLDHVLQNCLRYNILLPLLLTLLLLYDNFTIIVVVVDVVTL